MESLLTHTRETTMIQITITLILAKLGQPFVLVRSVLQVFMLVQALFVQDVALLVRSLSLCVLIPRYLGLVILLETISFFEHWIQIWSYPWTSPILTNIVKVLIPCLNLAFPSCILFQINTMYETLALWALLCYEGLRLLQQFRMHVKRELLIEPYH